MQPTSIQGAPSLCQVLGHGVVSCGSLIQGLHVTGTPQCHCTRFRMQVPMCMTSKSSETTDGRRVHFELIKTYAWFCCMTSLVAQTAKHLPVMRETRVRPLGWEDPLEKEMATHSSTLAWKIPWMEERGRL